MSWHGWNLAGLLTAIGLPVLVMIAAVFWPEPSDHDDNDDR
jgi:hypothetical protein